MKTILNAANERIFLARVRTGVATIAFNKLYPDYKREEPKHWPLFQKDDTKPLSIAQSAPAKCSDNANAHPAATGSFLIAIDHNKAARCPLLDCR